MTKPSSEELADGLVMAAIRLTRTLRAPNRSGKLTEPEISALAVIVYAGKIRAKDLAEYEEVSAAAISVLIKQLEAKEFVRRSKDADDGRALWITATPHGARLLRDGHAKRLAPLVAAISELSERDRARVGDATSIVDRLTAMARDRGA